MREAPGLWKAALVRAVEAEYSLPIRSLSFLPLGADSASAAYRAEAIDGTVYFLKIRAPNGFSPASLLVPLHLHKQRVPHVLAPLPTKSQAAWVSLEDFAFSLYTFVEGRMGADAGLSNEQWIELGETLRQIHRSRLPAELVSIIPHEKFIPSRREVIGQLQTAIESRAGAGPVQGELAEFWDLHRKEIGALVERADALGEELRSLPAPGVLCHADLHTWNILLDSRRQLWIVDWDETVLALKERDLMFVVGGIGSGLVSPEQTSCFLQGYGEVEINLKALAYYRYAWAVQDMGAYGEQALFLPSLSEVSRRGALDGFKRLFAPGNIVDIAFGSTSLTP